jgi:digeranylgeranylglycerophospholipid reductase
MHDIVIAGCGIAGAVAGLTALKNVDTCIVEKVERDSIGKKICGELMTQKALSFLREEFDISVPYYPLKGLAVISSSGYTSHVEESLCTVDRLQLGQALAARLIDTGASIVYGTVKGPVGKSCVQGVKTKDSVYHSKVTIDCSGVASVVRRAFMDEPTLLGVAYKENVILKEPFPEEYAMLMFDKSVIPSGYMWCFPKSEYELNVGAGGLQWNIPLKKIVKNVVRNLAISVKKRDNTGFGVVPLGRPLSSLVYPGLLVCGDAACQVNPLTGEGIAPAVTAGYHAGTVASKAVQKGDSSLYSMWKYNCDCAQAYGRAHASLVVARNFLVSLSDDELALFLTLVTGDDLGHLIKGRVHFPLMKKVKILFHNWKKLVFLYRLYNVLRRMNRIRALYAGYPEGPDEFFSWKKNLDCTIE